MAYKTFNGWNIIPMPATPVLRQIDFSIHDSIGETSSPFTGQAQQQQWVGGDWWGPLNIATPPMHRAQANAWIGWLAEMRGKLNVFQLGDPSGIHPVGTPQGTPVCNCASPGYNQPNSTILFTRGWKPSTTRLLLPGDYMQIGYRLHIVSGVAPVNSDVQGNAQISIWPSIRELPTDGEPIILANAKGLFRLAENDRIWTAREKKVIPFSFKIKEAK